MDGLTKPLFLGRLRHERLTSNQMVGQYIRSFAWRHKQPIYFSKAPVSEKWMVHVYATSNWHGYNHNTIYPSQKFVTVKTISKVHEAMQGSNYGR